jgi:arylsulfatase A
MLTHGPYQPTPDSQSWDPKAVGEKVNQRPEHFRDMVEYMDKLIGQLLARLDALGLRENTLVMFLGDNGTGRGTPSQMGERTVVGGKGRTVRTGMHVPLIVHWPGSVVAGQVHDDLIDSTDILPTLCAAARVTVPADLTLDGRSFLPQLRGEPGRPREWIYSWYSPRQGEDRTVREFALNRRYKLYRDGSFFDLQTDPEEAKSLNPRDLDGEAAAAARMLRGALDQFKGARSARLDAVNDAPTRAEPVR